MTYYDCPVCGYDELNKPPKDYYICPSCGTEFESDDFDRSYRELRADWIEKDMPWFDRSTLQPKTWNGYRQLIKANYGSDLIAHPRFQADVNYRYAVNKAFADVKIAMQLKVNREIRREPKAQMTQFQLAEKAGMKQSRISELEGRDYSSWTISTLERLAKALDLGFDYSFVPWGELRSRVTKGLSPGNVWMPSFKEEAALASSGVIETGRKQSIVASVNRMFVIPPVQDQPQSGGNVVQFRRQGNESRIDESKLRDAGRLSAEKATA